jgi:CO/xanthine dehydrogenase Mo-binding subunit
VVASYERGTGNMTLWLSTQAPHLERSAVVDVLGFPENKLRVIAGEARISSGLEGITSLHQEAGYMAASVPHGVFFSRLPCHRGRVHI